MCVCQCVYVCVVFVSAPEGISNWWCDVNPILLVEQVIQLLYSSYRWYC